MKIKPFPWRQANWMTALILGVGAGLGALFVLGKWILGVSQGFEFTDEGYYFLIVENPWKNLGNSFFGFFLHPLYLVAAGSPGAYRFFGLVILLVLGIWLARAWSASIKLTPTFWNWAAHAAIVSGTLLVFSNGRRTPAYDYLVFVGGVLAWGGYFRALAGSLERTTPWLILGAGLGTVAVAKWSAVLPLGLIFLFLTRPWSDARARKGWGWALTAGFGVVGGTLGYAGTEAIVGIFRQAKLLTDALGTHGLGLLAYYVPTLVNFVYRSMRAFVYGLPLLLILVWSQKRNARGQANLLSWSWLLPWLIVGAGFLFGLAKAGANSFSRVGSNVFAEQLWVLAAFWVLDRKAAQACLQSFGAIIFGLLATPFALGFGTASALGDYTGHGAVFFLLTGLFIWKAFVERGAPIPLVAAFLFVATILNLGRAHNSLENPYRSEVPNRCHSPWEIPGGGRVVLDSDRAAVVEAISQVFQQEGFRPGDPIIAIGNLPGVVSLLGGWSPGTPWYYDTHPRSLDFVTRVLGSISPDLRNSAWLLLRENSGLIAHQEQILALMHRDGVIPLEVESVRLEGQSTRLFIWPPLKKAR